jgi:geranylgeranyl pyrophosphate synthase
MSFAEHQAQLKGRLETALAAQLGDWFEGLQPADLEALRSVLAHGKRLRGCVTCLVSEALGGAIEPALPAALAVELIQAASLVHDDFVDGDVLRRDRPAAWTVLMPRRAVLLADVVFATAIEKMAAAGAAEAATLSHAIAAMARGAFQEMVDPADAYRRVVQLKTGSLFAAAAKLGALAARAEPVQIEAAHEFGARTGEAYQIADDLADGAGRDGISPGVRQRMTDEIAVLVGRARAALAPFPDNACTHMLGEAPAEFVRMMAAARDR